MNHGRSGSLPNAAALGRLAGFARIYGASNEHVRFLEEVICGLRGSEGMPTLDDLLRDAKAQEERRRG